MTKRKLSGIALLLFAFVLAMTVSACAKTVKLDTPQIVKNGNVVEWKAIDHATGYQVIVNGEIKQKVTSTSYTFDETEVGVYRVKVRALTTNEKYKPSDDSNELLFEVLADEGDAIVYVTDSPYGAEGNGKTNDRAAIQKAIDDVSASGGGTVVLKEGKTFLSGNLFLKSNVTLFFENGAMLKQSSDPDAFVKPVEGGYEPQRPVYGHDISGVIEWNHAWYFNYPLVHAGEGVHDVKVVGNGTIKMMGGSVCAEVMHMVPIGFYRTSRFEISDISITNYNSYAMFLTTSNNGLIKNLTIKDYECGNCDGISMQNCQDMRVTGCDIKSGDDSIYIWSSYNDPRGGTWWSSENPQPSKNFEIDNNESNAGEECKAFGLILWGLEYHDLSQVEISNVYIHDNYFHTMGIWTYYPFGDVSGDLPLKHFRWENNKIDIIQNGFDGVAFSDTNHFPSMKRMINGDFEYAGEGFWVLKPNENESSAGVRTEQSAVEENTYGFIDRLDEGDAKIYQGLYLDKSQFYKFSAKLQTSGAKCRIFVRDLEKQELIAHKEFSNVEWETVEFEFQAPSAGNYHIGIERGNATDGWAKIDDASLKMIYGQQTIFVDESPTEVRKDAKVELGTRFSAESSGMVTKVRIYTDENERGVHTVRIWDYQKNTVVAGPYDWDVAAGIDGWQEYTLPQPLKIKAATDYVVSVSTGSDRLYSVQAGGFSEAVCDGYLVTYAGSGLYSETPGTMPDRTESGKHSYLRDVVFATDEQTIMTSQLPSFFIQEAQSIELGIKFAADTDGIVTKVRIFTEENQKGAHIVRIWDFESKTLIAGPYEWNVPSGTRGWQSYTLPQTVLIEADRKYIVSVSSATVPHGEGTNGFTKPIANGHLITYTDSGVYSNELGSMPDKTYINTNYMRDVCFVPLSDDEYSAEVKARAIVGLIEVLRGMPIEDITVFNAGKIRNAYNNARSALDAASEAVIGKISADDQNYVDVVQEALAAFDESMRDRLGIVYDAASGHVISVENGGDSGYIDGLNLMPSADSRLREGDLLKVAYYLTIEEITDVSGSILFAPLVQRKSLSWQTMADASLRVNYSDLSATDGKLIVVFVIKLQKDFDGKDDAIAPRIVFNSGIRATLDRLMIAGEECDFAAAEGYSLACEKEVSEGNLATKESPVIYYRGDSGASCDGDGSVRLEGLNLMPSENNPVKGGEILKVAYYLTVTETIGNEGSFLFEPLVQRNGPDGWTTTAQGRILVNYSELLVQNGNIVLVFLIRLPNDFDGATDAVVPRLVLNNGFKATLDKLVIAPEGTNFTSVDGFTIGCEVAVNEGELILQGKIE